MTNEEKAILDKVKAETADKGRCTLSMGELARTAGLDRKTTKETITQMIKQGHLCGCTAWVDGIKRWALRPARRSR